jgi:hypothetical protein
LKKALFFFILITPIVLLGQSKKQGEIGLFAGGAYYMGELNNTPFIGTLPAGGFLYRHTFDTRFAAKGIATIGKAAGHGDKINGAYHSFDNLFYDVSISGEINFMQFIAANKNFDFTPYAHAGFGFMFFQGKKTVSDRNTPYINIPFGVGAKFNINSQWSWGVEYTLKKTFDDELDYSYQIPTESVPLKQQGYLGNKDWVHVFGVYITHKIKYRAKCPAFD